jgi:hypothetical protein
LYWTDRHTFFGREKPEFLSAKGTTKKADALFRLPQFQIKIVMDTIKKKIKIFEEIRVKLFTLAVGPDVLGLWYQLFVVEAKLFKLGGAHAQEYSYSSIKS